MIGKQNESVSFKTITNRDCENKCPYCKYELPLYDSIMQRCAKCKRLKDVLVEDIETKLKRKIHGRIFLYDFSTDKKEIVFFTFSVKKENLYLYNTEFDKISWAKRVPFRPYGFCNAPLKRIFYFKDRIVIVIASSSAMGGSSFLFSYQGTTGDRIGSFEVEGKWTNVIKCKRSIIVGCRNGFIYRLDSDLNVKNEFCIKDPTMSYGSPYSIPAPFNIITNDAEEFIAFSSEAIIFLFDSDLNFLWSKNMPQDIRVFKFIGNSSYPHAKYSWACRTLEINIKSTEDQIKRAFRKKALQWHPDRHKEEDKNIAEEKFKDIANAYELLSEIGEKELSLELEKIKRPNFMLSVSIYDRIGKIDFIQVEGTECKYIRVATKRSGIEKIYNLTGQCIETKHYVSKLIKEW